MGFFNKTRYFRTLLFLLPIGMCFTYYGGNHLLVDVNKFPQAKGVIEKIENRDVQYKFKNTVYTSPTTIITMTNNQIDYTTTIKSHMEIIDKSLSIGDIIIIWLHTDNRKNEIAQIEKGDKIIIPYEKSIGMAWGFLLAGLITSFIAIGYLIKYPEDILGNKKS
ncbi:hypothetical protein [Williamwhitmania taraxaci]|uniref:DUF3592 domain-containing protein n=1 Tax=Williamwhitmania taraxaci TaxID=1640674 RepID=A0A1G6MRH4_9BACT|nr:hypothetical protein [Williamwhitmania taraxaci]SDC58188.1 hypothetical protein SAMN05216323_10386 [Williamwhitmania taraxaci]